MNIIETKNFLEYANKDDLVNMMQEPNPHFPAFLVLSEIQRRTIHDQNFQAMLDRPTTTVAEEVVNNFAQPQLAQNQPTSLQAGAQQASLLPTSVSAGLPSAPASAPMQMAASGGITGYANTGQTEFMDDHDIFMRELTKLIVNDIAFPGRVFNSKFYEEYRPKYIAAEISDRADKAKRLGLSRFDKEYYNNELKNRVREITENKNPLLEKRQIRNSGGITGFANTGSTSLPAGSAPYPVNMPIEKLARMLGVDMYAPDGSLKNSAVLEAEMRERFAAYNQSAVGNTSNLPVGSVPIPATASPSTVTDTSVLPVGSQPRIIDPVAIQNQLSKTVPSALGIDQDKVAGLSQVNTPSVAPVSTLTDPTGETTAEKYIKLMESGTFKTKPISVADLGQITPNRLPIPEIPKDERDYFKVSDEDRQKELDVYALGTLAKAIGTARNLGELGTGVGETALGLSQIKKGQRKEQRDIANLEFQDKLGMYGLNLSRIGIINEAITSDSIAEQNAKWNVLKLNFEKEGLDADRMITVIRNDALIAQIAATNNARLDVFVRGFMTELDTLKEKSFQNEADIKRIAELENLISRLLFDATQKAGVNMEEIVTSFMPSPTQSAITTEELFNLTGKKK